MFPGAGERGHCTSGMFAGGASDPPVCANDLCRDTAFPFKHPAVDVCYNAEGYEDYLKKGWSSCGTWCENTKGAGWQGCDANPPACNKCADHPTYKHYHDWALHTWHQPLQVCYNDEGWSNLNSHGSGGCGTFCALPGTCPGGSCHGCSGVPECEAVYLAASSTAPPSGGRRLFEPDKPLELSEGAQEARRLLGAAPRELGGLPDEGRELFEKKAECEDSADEVVAKISEEALGRPVSSCVEVMALGACSHAMATMHCPATCGLCDTSCEDSADEVVQQLSQEALGRALSCAGLKDIVGACHRAIVMKHCPASCGLCEDREYLERHMELANTYGEMNHRQLKKTC